jgi:hypothetical protein
VIPFLLQIFLATWVFADFEVPCAETKPGKICVVDMNFVRPTQGAVGELEVRYKRSKYRQAMQEALQSGDPAEAYDEFLQGKKRTLEVVIGPSRVRKGGKPTIYIIDRHHTSRGLFLEFEELSLAQKKKIGGFPKAYAHLAANLSHLSVEEFEEVMERPYKYAEKNPKYFSDGLEMYKNTSWVRLKGENGQKLSGWEKLPQHLDEIPDDPYRSAAWLLGQSDAYLTTKEPFVEFKIADRLRAEFGRKEITRLMQKNPDEAAFVLGRWAAKNLNDNLFYTRDIVRDCKANFAELVRRALLVR